MTTSAQLYTSIIHSSTPDAVRNAMLSALPSGGSKRAMRIRDWMSRRLEQYPQQTYYRGRRHAESIATRVWDEHGGLPSNCSLHQRDYVPPSQSRQAPYYDTGRAGLGLVSVTRSTTYRGAYKGWTSTCCEAYLVGRNEIGTWWAHRVHPDCTSVRAAIDWIWSGRSAQIVRRQGDIAVIAAAGPKGLDKLPTGHRVDAASGMIMHATHPAIALPGIGERVIVARRAAQRGNGAGFGTRD